MRKAALRAKAVHRSTAGQIKFWASVGQLAEENPDLSFAFIHEILISLEEAKGGELDAYVFGEGDEA